MFKIPSQIKVKIKAVRGCIAMEKDAYTNNNSQNNDFLNEKTTDEVVIDANDSENCEEGAQNLCEELSSEEKAVDEEKENFDCEEENSRKEGRDGSKALQHGNLTGETAEYVWNGGASSSSRNAFEGRWAPDGREGGYSSPYGNYSSSPDVPKKDAKKAWIIALVAVCAILAIAVGVLGAFLIEALYPEAPVGSKNDDIVKDETISVTKNNSSIDVEIIEGSTGYNDLTRIEVINLVADAVVEITTSKVQTNSFFGGNYVTSGAGSGVVIAQSEQYAFIVTNYHVVEGATKVQITLTDKTVLEAEYLDGDASSDIAMLRVETDKVFPKVVCGSSKELRVGADVIAIGNPLGSLGGTVTEGIVSALDREIAIEGTNMKLIQISAAVNPGNSGGGLFNMAGELVGIVNAKHSAEGIEGLGFAIPIDSVYDMLIEIIETRYIHGRPTIGIEAEYVSDTFDAYRKYGVGATGVFVTSSNNDALMPKDLIRSINGQLVTDASSYAAAMSELKIGDKVKIEVYRNRYLTEVEVEVTEYVPAGIFG